MPYSKCDFSIKFFRPSQRTVISHNGFLDTRTKHIIARDRLIVAEQRTVEIERQKSTSTLQLLSFERKQLEKKQLSLRSLTLSRRIRSRSISESNIHALDGTGSLNEASNLDRLKADANLTKENQNCLFLPTANSLVRTTSLYSDGNLSENPQLTSDTESSEEEENKHNLKLEFEKVKELPLIAIIPPDDDDDDDDLDFVQ